MKKYLVQYSLIIEDGTSKHSLVIINGRDVNDIVRILMAKYNERVSVVECTLIRY